MQGNDSYWTILFISASCNTLYSKYNAQHSEPDCYTSADKDNANTRRELRDAVIPSFIVHSEEWAPLLDQAVLSDRGFKRFVRNYNILVEKFITVCDFFLCI